MDSMQLNTYNIFRSFTTDTSLRLKRTYDGHPTSVSYNYRKFSLSSGSGRQIYLPSFNDIRTRSGLYLKPRAQYWLEDVFHYYQVPIVSGIPTTILANSSQKIPALNEHGTTIGSINYRSYGLSLRKTSYNSGLYFSKISIYTASSGTITIYPSEGSSSSHRACVVSQAIQTSATGTKLQNMQYPIPVIYRIDHNANDSFTCYYRCNIYNNGSYYRTIPLMLWVS